MRSLLVSSWITLLGLSGSFAVSSSDLRSFDWMAYFDAKIPECIEPPYNRPTAVRLSKLDFHDFDRDGREEAILIGWTCHTGTAGPDIHAVYTSGPNGLPVELPFDERLSCGIAPGESLSPDLEDVTIRGLPLPLVGNRNFDLFVEGDLLCAEHHDGSEAEPPLSRCFRFENGRFVLKELRYSPVYETGFDCRKARTDREILTCRSERLARLDLELNRIYMTRIAGLDAPERELVIDEQLRWLHEIDNWGCYKFCNDQLVDRYVDRIEELERATD